VVAIRDVLLGFEMRPKLAEVAKADPNTMGPCRRTLYEVRADLARMRLPFMNLVVASCWHIPVLGAESMAFDLAAWFSEQEGGGT
jgi:hypothetical protein